MGQILHGRATALAAYRTSKAISRRRKKNLNLTRSAIFIFTARQFFAKQTMRGDIAEVRTEQGKIYLFVAIDRTSKFAFVELKRQEK